MLKLPLKFLFVCHALTRVVKDLYLYSRELKIIYVHLWQMKKTSALSILSIEDEVVRSIDWNDIVEKFAKLKARKQSFL